MRDPRIDRLLLRIGETNARGAPTRVSELAGQVKDILVEIEKLRSELEVSGRQVVALTARELTLRKSVMSIGARHATSMVSGANALQPDNISEFSLADDPDIEYHRERLETVVANLKSRRRFIQRTQDLLATRIATVQRTLDSFVRTEEAPTKPPRIRRRFRRVRRRR